MNTKPKRMQISRRDIELAGRLATRDEAGRHFTEWADKNALDRLERAALIEIYRPIHEATGISYSQEFWGVQASPLLDAADMWDARGELREEWADLLNDERERRAEAGEGGK